MVQEIKILLKSSVSDDNLIAAVSKETTFEKESNLVLSRKRQLIRLKNILKESY